MLFSFLKYKNDFKRILKHVTGTVGLCDHEYVTPDSMR